MRADGGRQVLPSRFRVCPSAAGSQSGLSAIEKGGKQRGRETGETSKEDQNQSERLKTFL